MQSLMCGIIIVLDQLHGKQIIIVNVLIQDIGGHIVGKIIHNLIVCP